MGTLELINPAKRANCSQVLAFLESRNSAGSSSEKWEMLTEAPGDSQGSAGVTGAGGRPCS